MTFEEMLDHAVAMLQRRGRMTYRALRLHFQLDEETLEALNRGYLLAAEKSDVAWYEKHLADDYRATNPDGSFVDKPAFLARIGRPHTFTSFRAPRAARISALLIGLMRLGGRLS